jgi:hypothetical protein
VKKTFVLLLSSILLIVGTVACSQTVYQQVTGYVNDYLPIAEAVANMVLATEAPDTIAQAQVIEAQVNQDLQLVETTAATITTTNYADQAVAIKKLAADAKAQLAAYLTVLHITNPATVAKVTALVDLGDAVIDEIVNALPASAAPAKMVAFKIKAGNLQSNYRHQFNRIIRAKTGDARVDGALAKVHQFRHKVLGVGTLAY